MPSQQRHREGLAEMKAVEPQFAGPFLAGAKSAYEILLAFEKGRPVRMYAPSLPRRWPRAPESVIADRKAAI